jgi:hypothetical protein
MVAAQERPALALDVSPGSGQLMVRVGDLLSDEGVASALHSGLPVRIRVVAELWKDRLFDSEEARAEWRATVVYEPLERTYRVQTSSSEDEERIVATLAEAGRVLSRRVMIGLRPREPGRYYYIAHLEAETLSLSDLEELARWLRGDLAPAVAGEERMEGALGRGVNRLLVRVLGMPAKRVRVKTPAFDATGEAPPPREPPPPDAPRDTVGPTPPHRRSVPPARPDTLSDRVPWPRTDTLLDGAPWPRTDTVFDAPPLPPTDTVFDGADQSPCGTTALRTTSDSIMSRSGSTAMPAPVGSDSVPSCITNSGLTMSFSQ